MGATADLHTYPLCHFFIGKYLSLRDDPTNFQDNQFPDIARRYDNLFASALETLAATKEALKRWSDFSFDSGDANNLESGIATLRVVEALRLAKFQNICLVVPKKGLTCRGYRLREEPDQGMLRSQGNHETERRARRPVPCRPTVRKNTGEHLPGTSAAEVHGFGNAV